jgi:hypothetical protein
MSDERLDELGIPRRRFLKRAATAAFVAPVVVSFGLEGAATAQAHLFQNQPNQTFPFPNQNDQGQNDNSQGQGGNSQ